MPWDLVASAYTAELIPMFELFARDALRLAAPPAGSRIVDVACGPGSLSLLAAAEGLTVDAIDFSPEMLGKLRERAASMPAITPQLGDGQALPYADATFSAGFSMFGLMFFPDRAKGFSELRRVLAPGARAVVSSWAPIDSIPMFRAMFGTLQATMKSLLGDNAPQPGAAINPLSTPDLCQTEMSAAFSDVQVHTIDHGVQYESADAYWASVERTMAPLVLTRRKLGEAHWGQVSDAVRAALRDVAGPGPVTPMMRAYLSVGTA